MSVALLEDTKKKVHHTLVKCAEKDPINSSASETRDVGGAFRQRLQMFLAITISKYQECQVW